MISFLDPRIYHGGGEMVSRRLLEVGVERGHDIRVAAVRPQRESFHSEADLNFFVDIFNFGHSFRSLGAWREFGQRFLLEMMESAPFVHLTNAYVDICNLPYLPCSGERDSLCPLKPQLSIARRFFLRDWENECFADKKIVRALYEKSILNVYLSPLHQKTTESLLRNGHPAPGYVLRPLIDTQRFNNQGKSRDIEYLFVGVVSEAKGLKEIRRRFGDKNVHFIGRCFPGTKLDFGTYLGHVSYEEIPQYMNRAQNFIFLPRWPEPQGRVVAEAALCGCKIIGNDNVGALSFDMDLADPKNYSQVEENFWAQLERLV